MKSLEEIPGKIKPTLRQSQAAFALDVCKLITYINELGFTVTLGECYRTPEQAALNAKKGIGIKDSLHIKRLAIDLNVFDPDGNLMTDSKDYRPFGYYWEKLDPKNEWGGNWKKLVDGGHFQRNE